MPAIDGTDTHRDWTATAAMDDPRLTSPDGPATDLILRPPLAQQVADRIVEAIAAGAIRPGQRVTDTEIAARFGVSRNPVREAMKILEAQGIVTSNPHRSTQVVIFDQRKVAQIARARVAIEKIAFGDAAAAYAADPALLRELDRLIEAMTQSARQQDLLGITRADLAFHRAVCVASRNEIILTLWETIARHMRISFNLELQHDNAPPLAIASHHQALRDTLATGQRDLVEREIEGHILRLQRQA
ncbi:MAG: GntR family transcriptional regulator [Dongiaceae bacterium]